MKAMQNSRSWDSSSRSSAAREATTEPDSVRRGQGLAYGQTPHPCVGGGPRLCKKYGSTPPGRFNPPPPHHHTSNNPSAPNEKFCPKKGAAGKTLQGVGSHPPLIGFPGFSFALGGSLPKSTTTGFGLAQCKKKIATLLPNRLQIPFG